MLHIAYVPLVVDGIMMEPKFNVQIAYNMQHIIFSVWLEDMMDILRYDNFRSASRRKINPENF